MYQDEKAGLKNDHDKLVNKMIELKKKSFEVIVIATCYSIA